MPDRADTAAAVLTAVSYAAALTIGLVVFPNSLNGNLPGVATFIALTVLIFPYAAYWALSIRHALAVPLYRRQAFGIAFIVLALWFTIAILTVVPSTWPLAAYTVITNYTFYFLFVVLFYWIDASILASRRSDPLLRDTLYWSKIRIPFWIFNIIVWGIILSMIGYFSIVGDATFLNSVNSGSFPNTPFFQVINIIYNLPFLVLVCGIIYLPAIAIRSKYDKSLRRHFLWFTPTAAGLLLLFFGVFNSLSLPGHLLSGLVFVLIGYTLYRSARSLAPINRLLTVETKSTGAPGVVSSSPPETPS